MCDLEGSMFSASLCVAQEVGVGVMLRTFRFDDHCQHKAKLKGQPHTIEGVLFNPRAISWIGNDETKEEDSRISTQWHLEPKGSQTG
jgi:hypothetical protein